MRKGNGKLHYFINGVDQGVATDKVDQTVWAVVDLYGMTVKVSFIYLHRSYRNKCKSLSKPHRSSRKLIVFTYSS